MAEGILTHLAEANGLDWRIDSAGTGSWHVGENPDNRAIHTCRSHGIDISGQRARQFKSGDAANFDLILAMDHSNLRDVRSVIRNEAATPVVGLITDLAGVDFYGIPDPYYDGGFDEVFELLWQASQSIITKYRSYTTAN